MCILLRRLCYPNRLYDLERMFQRDATVLSRISNWMTKFVSNKYEHLLRSLRHDWMRTENMVAFANVRLILKITINVCMHEFQNLCIQNVGNKTSRMSLR
jgi:hypothetical protein